MFENTLNMEFYTLTIGKSSMLLHKWQIGLDIHHNKIQLVAATRHRHGWQLRECWQHSLPIIKTQDTETQNIRITTLKNILQQWCKKLPNNCDARFSLSTLQILKSHFLLPEKITLTEPEIGWLVHSKAETLFPMDISELVLDYRIYQKQIYLCATRRSDIVFWSELLHEVGFSLSVIDISPNALRYLAHKASITDNTWLIYRRQQEWICAGPLYQSIHYQPLEITEVDSIEKLVLLLPKETQQQPNTIFYLGNDTKHHHFSTWSLLDSFQYYSIKLPKDFHNFAIAAGLALREVDK